jgi:hypothetical protein
MATFEAKPNTGSLWAVQDRPEDTYPNLRGDIHLDRDFIIGLLKKNPSGNIKVSLGAWNATTKTGKDYVSLRASEPYEKPAESSTKNPWDN